MTLKTQNKYINCDSAIHYFFYVIDMRTWYKFIQVTEVFSSESADVGSSNEIQMKWVRVNWDCIALDYNKVRWWAETCALF